MHKYRIYCGPTLVRDLARRLGVSGYKVDYEGTEHVYITTSDSVSALLTFLGRQCYSTNDIFELGYYV